MNLAPRLPDFLDQIQFLRFWAFNDCELPWTAYIETALPIAGDIAVAYLAIDALGFTKTILRPKVLRSGRHTRRGPRGKKGRGGIPEPADMIADILDPDGTIRPRQVGLGGRLLIHGLDTVERAGYLMFLADVVPALGINSIIGALELNPRNCPNVARLQRHNDFGTIGGATPGFIPYNLPTLDYAVGMSAGTGFGTQIFDGTACLVFAGTVRKITVGGTVAFRLQKTGSAEETLDEMETNWLEPGDTAQFICSARIRPGDVVQWQVDVRPGFAQIIEGEAFGVQIDS